MKALKVIGGLIGLIILAIVILIIIGPKSYHVERSVEIDASAAEVWPYVSTLAAQNEWSPWAKRDPDQVTTFSGSTDGLVGAIVHWKGNKDVGEGEQEIKKVSENKRLETELRFIKPYESKSDAFIDLTGSDGKTKVTWGFSGKNKIPMNAFMVFVNMDKAVGSDFEEGLSNLKKMVEENAGASSSGDFTINEIAYEGGTFVTNRSEIPVSQIGEFYGTNYGELMGKMQTMGLEMMGYPSGLYYDWNNETKMTDLAAAIPVPTGSAAEDMDIVVLENGPAVSIDYYGPYEGIGSAHEAIEAWLQMHDQTALTPVIEQYITDPMEEPDSSKWLTKVIYRIEEK